MKVSHILDRYIGKMIFSVTLTILGIFLSLSGIIKFVDQMKKTGQGDYDALGAGLYTVLNIPKDVQLFFPISALLGVLLGLWVLEHRSELISMQASGFSHMQVICSVMKMAIPLVLFVVAINEWIAPRSDWIAQKYRKKAIYGVSFFSSHNEIWVKDNNEFTYIKRIKNKNQLDGIVIYTLNNYCKIQSIRSAATAKFDTVNRLWKLSKVVSSDLTGRIKISRSEMTSAIWKTRLTPDSLNIITMNPNMISVSDLYGYIKYLKETGQNFKQFQLNMWKKIFHPIFTLVMMLTCLSFIFYPSPEVIPIGIRMITGISCGFIFYVLYHILGPLSLLYDVPAFISLVLLNILLFIISVCFLLKRL